MVHIFFYNMWLVYRSYAVFMPGRALRIRGGIWEVCIESALIFSMFVLLRAVFFIGCF